MLHRHTPLVGNPLHLGAGDDARADEAAVAGVLPRDGEVVVAGGRLDEGPRDGVVGLAGRGGDVADAEVRHLRPGPAPGAVFAGGEGDVVFDAVGVLALVCCLLYKDWGMVVRLQGKVLAAVHGLRVALRYESRDWEGPAGCPPCCWRNGGGHV